MDSKKFLLPGHILSPRRKVISGFVLCVTLIIISVLLLSNSFNGRVVFSSFAVNSSLVSWPFPFSGSYFPSSVSNDSGAKELHSFSGLVPKTIDSDRLEKARNRNSTAHLKNVSTSVEEGRVEEKTQKANGGKISDSSRNLNRNGSVLDGNHLDNFSDIVKNESSFGGEGTLIRNSSLSGVGFMNANRSTEGKSLGHSGDLNSSISNLLYNGEVGRSSGVEGNKYSSLKTCDIFDGRWVRDDLKPYYPKGSCPHIDRDFDCHLNGRPDDGYVKWKWQPNGCNIPRLRGQKLVFVGDSLNRNMWESLVCILRHSIRDKKKVYEISGRSEFKKKGFYAFRFEDYNSTVDFVGSPFLVRESSFASKNGTFETLRLDLMDQTTKMYQDADIIIFNTGHWWTHEKTSRGEDYYQEGNHVHSRLKVLEAYKRALLTWARWLDKNIDYNRTQVFFRGYSVTHFRGGQWNSGGQCHKEAEPIFDKTYLGRYPSKMRALDYVLKETKSPVVYLNISKLTDYRKDAHPSIYRKQYNTAEELKAAELSQDCSHWCLPGVPDTWNELLYVSLLKVGRGSWRF